MLQVEGRVKSDVSDVELNSSLREHHILTCILSVNVFLILLYGLDF